MGLKDVIVRMIESKGYSLRSFSEKIDIPYTTLRSMLDRGIASSGVDNAIKLGRELGIPVEDLYNLEKGIDINSNKNRFMMIPLVGYIPAGEPALAEENILDYILTPSEQVADGTYFYLEVKGDSMIGANILPGYQVLVRAQPEVDNGSIAVVQVNSHEATLKRVKYEGDRILLIAENPLYPTQVLKHEDARIIGKVTRVMFDPQ